MLSEALEERSRRTGRFIRLTLAALVATSLALTTGCAALQGRAKPRYTPSSDNDLASERLLAQPFALAVSEDAIVRLVGPTVTCTGTIIDDDLILTAHHCLVERGPRGEFTKKVLDPTVVKVELGGDYFAWGEVSVRAIVTPPCGEAGGAGDVAVLVLTRKLVGLSTMSPRLDAPPRIGEDIQPVGFGRCTLSGDGIRRKPRSGGTIRAITSETMHLDASICPGDSGGAGLRKGLP